MQPSSWVMSSICGKLILHQISKILSILSFQDEIKWLGRDFFSPMYQHILRWKLSQFQSDYHKARDGFISFPLNPKYSIRILFIVSKGFAFAHKLENFHQIFMSLNPLYYSNLRPWGDLWYEYPKELTSRVKSCMKCQPQSSNLFNFFLT